MDLESLLPVLFSLIFLLVFFVSILRSLKKVLEKAKTPARSGNELQTDRKPGWKDLLGNAFAHIQKEIKAAQERQEQLAMGEKPGGGDNRRSNLVWDKNAPIPTPPPLPAMDAPKKKFRAGETPAAKPDAVQAPKTDPAAGPEFETSPAELRKAVVWSEILAPPLALREDRDRLQNF